MINLTYHAPVRALINLTLPWHSFSIEIADCNFDMVTGKLFKSIKSLKPATPWGTMDFLFA